MPAPCYNIASKCKVFELIMLKSLHLFYQISWSLCYESSIFSVFLLFFKNIIIIQQALITDTSVSDQDEMREIQAVDALLKTGRSVRWSSVLPGKDSMAIVMPLSSMNNLICTMGSFRSSFQTPYLRCPFSKMLPSSFGRSSSGSSISK